MKKQKKYQKGHVEYTTGTNVRDAFYAATDADAPLADNQLAAGLVQHPDTGYWQIWLSTNGLDLTMVAAHYDQAQAQAALSQFQAFLASPGVYNATQCETIFSSMRDQSDAEPQILPDDLVRQITRGILRRVVDGPH